LIRPAVAGFDPSTEVPPEICRACGIFTEVYAWQRVADGTTRLTAHCTCGAFRRYVPVSEHEAQVAAGPRPWIVRQFEDEASFAASAAPRYDTTPEVGAPGVADCSVREQKPDITIRRRRQVRKDGGHE
jgi:hypothetical protein